MDSMVFKALMVGMGGVASAGLVFQQLQHSQVEVIQVASPALVPVFIGGIAVAGVVAMAKLWKNRREERVRDLQIQEVSWFEENREKPCSKALRHKVLAVAAKEGSDVALARRLESHQGRLNVGELWVMWELSRIESGLKSEMADSAMIAACEIKL